MLKDLFVIFLTLSLCVTSDKIKFAICVTGQTSRFLPKLLIPLFEKNPDVEFSLFYNFQASTDLIYSTLPENSYDPSPYVRYSTSNELKPVLQALYEPHTNVHVNEIRFTVPRSRAEWGNFFRYHKLDKIWQYTYIQERLLNMFEKMSACSEMIQSYKDRSGENFDYISNIKEDTIIMKDMNLRVLFEQIKDSTLGRTVSNCDILAKGCLNWGGITMRGWIFSEKVGLKYLGYILEWYGHLVKTGQAAYNPEQFSFQQANHMGLKHCGISVDLFPMTSARHTKNEEYCLIPHEFENCIPHGLEWQIFSKRCYKTKKI